MCGKSHRNTLVCMYGWDFSPLTPWFDVYLDVQNKHDQYIFLGDNANKRYLIFHFEGKTNTQNLFKTIFTDWKASNLLSYAVLNANESLLGVLLISRRA